MALRIFSVTGEALNFGGRRMVTIMRVAWLPVVLLLMLNMATVFAYLSVIAGEAITFSDTATFTRAQQLVAKFAPKGFEESPTAMWSIMAGNLALQTLLIASFMAPLIRYAGLGEKPRPGAVRLAFGPDQLRYIFAGIFSFLFVAVLVFAPIAAASFYVLKYILAALSQTTATFPDPNSLHTIEVTTVGQDLVSRGRIVDLSSRNPIGGSGAGRHFDVAYRFPPFSSAQSTSSAGTPKPCTSRCGHIRGRCRRSWRRILVVASNSFVCIPDSSVSWWRRGRKPCGFACKRHPVFWSRHLFDRRLF